MPNIFVIGGCNGAGKTTAAYNLMPDVFATNEFVNADEIAKGLSPLNPEGVAFQAGRIMIDRIQQLINAQKSFSFETTLSGLSYIRFLKNAKTKGFDITLFFVYLNSIELAQSRVALRVSKGGHNIDEDVISRRYYKGLKNFAVYAQLADDWYLYDNSQSSYELIAKRVNDEKQIFNLELYKLVNDYDHR